MEVLYFVANGKQYYIDENNSWSEQNNGDNRRPIKTKFIGSFHVGDANLGEVVQRLVHEENAGGFETDFVQGNYAFGVEDLSYVIEIKEGRLKLKKGNYAIHVTGPIEAVFWELDLYE